MVCGGAVGGGGGGDPAEGVAGELGGAAFGVGGCDGLVLCIVERGAGGVIGERDELGLAGWGIGDAGDLLERVGDGFGFVEMIIGGLESGAVGLDDRLRAVQVVIEEGGRDGAGGVIGQGLIGGMGAEESVGLVGEGFLVAGGVGFSGEQAGGVIFEGGGESEW